MAGVPLGLTVLTGFLGAGKTTLLNRLLADPALSDTAVVVNEFGEVAIDHLLVEQANDGVIELGGGCLCCSVRGELADTLEAIAGRMPAPRHVVVETSGLADPVAVIELVLAHPALARLYRPAGVITLVDAVNGAATLQAHAVARRQVAVADRIVVSKAQLAPEDAAGTLAARLEALNPRAGILDGRTAEAARLPEGIAVSREAAGAGHAHHGHDHDGPHGHGHAEYASVSLAHEAPLPQAAVEGFLDLLATQQGGRVLRIKGLAATIEEPERPLLVQGVRGFLHAPQWLAGWPEGAPRATRLVVIGEGLDIDYVRRIFAAFAGVRAADTPDRAALEDNPLAIAGFRP